MKKILCFLFILFSIVSFSQKDLDLKIDEGNALYNDGHKGKALKVWKGILRDVVPNSATYGTTLRNILWYYIEADDEKNVHLYYDQIISSKLNDRDENLKIGEPFKNYRYHSAMVVASFYAQKKKFKEALQFVTVADHDLTYETTSLTAFIFQKVDLAFWKYRLYKDLNQPDQALHALIKRAFEYDYKDIYPRWATVSPSTDEEQLAEEILTHFTTKESLQDFEKETQNAIENLKFTHATGKTIIRLSLKNMDYEIVVHSLLTSDADCKNYLENSFFYSHLKEKSK
ncbi:MAG TPA: hypothetical protein VJL37_10840 [Flavobacterium sp.]|nr:hypothetical protein [Flavobacterium sp.]